MKSLFSGGNDTGISVVRLVDLIPADGNTYVVKQTNAAINMYYQNDNYPGGVKTKAYKKDAPGDGFGVLVSKNNPVTIELYNAGTGDVDEINAAGNNIDVSAYTLVRTIVIDTTGITISAS